MSNKKQGESISLFGKRFWFLFSIMQEYRLEGINEYRKGSCHIRLEKTYAYAID